MWNASKDLTVILFHTQNQAQNFILICRETKPSLQLNHKGYNTHKIVVDKIHFKELKALKNPKQNNNYYKKYDVNKLQYCPLNFNYQHYNR